MGEEVDIFMAQMVRKRTDQPWGFRIEGGYDTQVPLRIALVSPHSPCGLIGLQPGDRITKIFNRQTKFLSHKQATEIISKVTGNELSLTVERTVSLSGNHQQTYPDPPLPHAMQQHDHEDNGLSSPQAHPHHQIQQTQPTHNSSPFTYSPLQQHQHATIPSYRTTQDFHFLPQSFKQTATIQLSSHNSPRQSPHQPSPRYQSPRSPQNYQHQPPDHLPQQHFKAQRPVPTRYNKFTEEEEDGEDGSKSPPPQSQTFRRLQNYMENNVPVSGPRGLPPPRSISNEQMRNHNRMKVVMPQRYNNPMGMYSTENVLDTFSSQVGSMLSQEE